MILASVNPPRLERGAVAGGEAGGRGFSQHDSTLFHFAQNVTANACEQGPHGFARSR